MAYCFIGIDFGFRIIEFTVTFFEQILMISNAYAGGSITTCTAGQVFFYKMSVNSVQERYNQIKSF